MSLDENKVIARQFLEAWCAGDAKALRALVTADFRDHTSTRSDEARAGIGHAAVDRQVAATTAAFGEMRLAIEDQIAEGDRVATRSVLHATHQSGQAVTVAGVGVVRVVERRVAEYWAYADTLALQRQLGMPPGGARRRSNAAAPA